MKDYNYLKELLDNKKVLYVPIVSSINRETNEYNLSADGNVNRFITVFSIVNTYKELTIVLPKNHIENSESIILDWAKENKVNILWCENFGKHAKDQRLNDEVIESVIGCIGDTSDYEVFIFESQMLGLTFSIDAMKIWWNPVSATKDKTRDFLEGYEDYNAKVIDIVDYMIVASPDQVKFYSDYDSKLIYIERIMFRNLKWFDYKTDNNTLDIINNKFANKKLYFLPFRLTDMGYKLIKVLEYLKSDYSDWVVLYSDPNNSKIIDNLRIKERFYKVSSDRDTYYTILDNTNATILYFEDIEFINHAAIWEFMDCRCKCNIILWQQHNNPYNVNLYSNFSVIDSI